MRKKIENFETLCIGSLLSSTQVSIGMVDQMPMGGVSPSVKFVGFFF